MSSVLSEIKQGVGILRLNRIEKYNAFNKEMAFTLQQKLDQYATAPNIRCIYITGVGNAFSAGQDLSEIRDPGGPNTATILSQHYNPIITKIRNLQKPVVAAVNGVAAGAGANIALACDVVIAAHSASFIQAFSKIGLVPDSGGSYFLPRLVGWQKALALAMTGDKVSALEAEAMGMVYKTYTDENFAEASFAMAVQLASMPTKSLGFIKQAFNQSMNNSLQEQLDIELRLQVEASGTEDYAEGIKAFFEKRKPVFIGR
ncbi:MAG: 2-(1,2-epoxy-1,2-dihydrophenyl)acetyl-CoA isomerase PaaG [Flavisolibacter sp.]